MISHSETILQLVLAALLGGLIGLERERKSWFAGLRTHMLVCMGSTLIMIVSQFGFERALESQLVVLDPSRVASQVVSGIGFLGAGTILFLKNMIRGLTTAASLWAVAAVGLAIGGSLYVAAVVTTLLILIILAGIKPLEKFLCKSHNTQEIVFTIKPGISLPTLHEILLKLDIRKDLKDIQIESDDNAEIVRIFLDTRQENILSVIDEIKNMPGIEKIEMAE